MMSTPQDLGTLAEMVTNGELRAPIASAFSLGEVNKGLARPKSGRLQVRIVYAGLARSVE